MFPLCYLHALADPLDDAKRRAFARNTRGRVLEPAIEVGAGADIVGHGRGWSSEYGVKLSKPPLSSGSSTAFSVCAGLGGREPLESQSSGPGSGVEAARGTSGISDQDARQSRWALGNFAEPEANPGIPTSVAAKRAFHHRLQINR